MVYQTFEAAVVDVPRPCLAPVVQAEAMPGAPGASAASVATGASTVSAKTISDPTTASVRRGMRGRACAGPRGLSSGRPGLLVQLGRRARPADRKSTRLNSSHSQ